MTDDPARGLVLAQPPRQRELPLSDAERRARIELAACYRVFDLLGWTESIFNHITLRVPGATVGDTVFLINPFGLHYCEVTASNLVAVDLHGTPVRPTAHPVNLAGFVTHSAIHGGIADAHCVMHTHTTSGCAVACLPGGLSPDNFYGAQLHGRVGYHDFEGVTVNADERRRLLASIGQQRAVVLRHHGLLSWGGSVPEALMWLWTLQRACDVQLAGAAAGAVMPLQTAVLEQTSREVAALQPAVCRAAFDAWVRRVDAIDPSYRT